VNIKAAG